MKKREILINSRERQLLFDACLQQAAATPPAHVTDPAVALIITEKVTTLINNLRTIDGMIYTAVGLSYTQETYAPENAYMAVKYVPQFDTLAQFKAYYVKAYTDLLVTLGEEALEEFFVDDEGPSGTGNVQYFKDDIVYPDPAAAVLWSDKESENIVALTAMLEAIDSL